jgi:hypothetical protein
MGPTEEQLPPAVPMAAYLKGLLHDKVIAARPAYDVLADQCAQLCEKWRADKNNPNLLGDLAIPESALILAATGCAEKPNLLSGTDIQGKRALWAVRGIVRLFAAMMQNATPKILAADLLANYQVYDSLKTQIDELEVAAAPRPLRDLKWEVIQRRVRAWNDARGKSDKEVCEFAFDRLKSDKLLKLIPVPRLRTYSSVELQEVATNFAEWNGLYEYLTARERRTKKPIIDDQISKLTKDLIQMLARRTKSSDVAVQEAWLRAIETAREPVVGYAFEEPFNAWLIKTALRSKKDKPAPPSLPGPQAAPATTSHADQMQAAALWLCRLWLIRLCSQTEKDWGRVKEIWNSRILFEDTLTDAQIAQLLYLETSERISMGNVAQIRRKMRMRLWVLQYVYQSPLTEPAPDDATVLVELELKFTHVEPKAKPTLFSLAALARAAREDRDHSLIWAGFAKRIVDRHKNYEEAAAALKSAGAFLRVGQNLDSLITTATQDLNMEEQRLKAARDWLDAQPKGISNLHNWAEKNHAASVKGAMWYLRVLCRKDSHDTVKVLNVPAAFKPELIAACGTLL